MPTPYVFIGIVIITVLSVVSSIVVSFYLGLIRVCVLLVLCGFRPVFYCKACDLNGVLLIVRYHVVNVVCGWNK